MATALHLTPERGPGAAGRQMGGRPRASKRLGRVGAVSALALLGLGAFSRQAWASESSLPTTRESFPRHPCPLPRYRPRYLPTSAILKT